MKKNGFTLIELLAVIVILAIIALIATPIILGIINDAKEKANERSVELYASAVKNGIAAYQLREGKEVLPGTYTSETLPFEVEYDGDVECTTIDIYEDGGVYVEGCTVNGTSTEYTSGTKQFKTYKNGEVVYFNVTTGERCDDYTESQSFVGVKEGCMKFYAFNDSESNDRINLLLDHNTTATVYWVYNSSGPSTSKNGPIAALEQLQSDTSSWKGTEVPTNYSLDQSGAVSGAKYTIDYDYGEYKARLITANEIAQITGNTGWDETDASSSEYFFHNLSQNVETGRGDVCASTGCTYGWLYDRTNTHCEDYGCLNNSEVSSRYWTATSRASENSFAWDIDLVGKLSFSGINGKNAGIRPVIEVLKSKLS